MRMRRQSAFNLIEVMIAIAVVAIIVGLAVPSYRSFVIRTNRVEGIDAAMATMICQERIYSRINAYDATECLPGVGGLTANGLYVVSIVTQNANQNVTITATPQGNQSDDSCLALALNEKGVRTASGAGAVDCWAGR